MNYFKIYIKIIRNAQNRKHISEYYEKHHIFPVSIFGKNKNIVKLSAREHYLAHICLEKIYIKRYGESDIRTKKMIKACFLMNNAKSKGQKRYVNSKLYESNKVRYINSFSGENHHFYGKKRVFTDEHLKNLRATYKKGEENPLYGIARSEETLRKMRKPKKEGHGQAVSRGRQGIIFSKEHRKNMSISRMGKPSNNKGYSKYTLEITNPFGIKETTNKLRDYCENNGIPEEMEYLIRVANGHRKHHKNFTVIIKEVK